MNTNKTIACVIPVIFLGLALFNGWPYGFFTLLRIVVTIAAVYLAWLSHEEKTASYWSLAFVGIGILFNPIIPIHLSREVWVWIDVVVGLFFLTSIYFFRIKKKD